MCHAEGCIWVVYSISPDPSRSKSYEMQKGHPGCFKTQTSMHVRIHCAGEMHSGVWLKLCKAREAELCDISCQLCTCFQQRDALAAHWSIVHMQQSHIANPVRLTQLELVSDDVRYNGTEYVPAMTPPRKKSPLSSSVRRLGADADRDDGKEKVSARAVCIAH